MIKNILKISSTLLFVFILGAFTFSKPLTDDEKFIEYRIDLKKQNLKLYWKDDNNNPFKNFQNLKAWLDLKGQKLVFAMNGGMYKTDNSPLGLFIEATKVVTPLNKRSGTEIST